MLQNSEESIVNISGYKFVDIPVEKLPEIREEIRCKTREMGLKGTVLLASEGVNIFVAATREVIDQFIELLTSYPYFQAVWFKESITDQAPYKRMLVKIKKEIIPMGCEQIKPAKKTAPHLAPEMLKRWYDEGKEMIILDTRNEYEVQLGTFEDAVHLNIRQFRQFPRALEKLDEAAKKQPVITFCTGGIRCEKAAALMMEEGFEEVYQLDGGIINYFEKCGGDHFEGECFVFDKRIGIDPSLRETTTIQCYACRSPITPDEQGGICPFCGDGNTLGR